MYAYSALLRVGYGEGILWHASSPYSEIYALKQAKRLDESLECNGFHITLRNIFPQ
jgi:hypothetical protein